MRTITLEGKEFPLRGSGETVLICMDELHKDMFEIVQDVMNGMTTGKPTLAPFCEMAYAFIKTANPDLFKSYKAFMMYLVHPGALIKQENVLPIMEEINDMMDMPAVNDEDIKKKTATTKKKN